MANVVRQLAAAADCADAARHHRRPNAAALRTLGIAETAVDNLPY